MEIPKSKGLLVIIVTLLIPAILGSIEIYKSFFPKEPDLRALWHIQQINLPQDIAAILISQREMKKLSPELLDRMTKGIYKELIRSDLEVYDRKRVMDWLDKFLKEDNLLEKAQTSQVLYVRIGNIGEAKATNAKLSVGSSGYYQIWLTTGVETPLKKGRTQGEVDIGDILPNTTRLVQFWPDASITNENDIVLNSEEGLGKVKSGIITRFVNQYYIIVGEDDAVRYLVFVVITLGAFCYLFKKNYKFCRINSKCDKVT